MLSNCLYSRLTRLSLTTFKSLLCFRCYVAYNGGEYAVNDPEVLTNPTGNGGSYTLQRYSGSFLSNAVPAGSENGDPWYSAVCPLNINGGVVNTPGKVRKSNPAQAYAPFDGEEKACSDYFLLVCS